jgi:hypothetical protein
MARDGPWRRITPAVHEGLQCRARLGYARREDVQPISSEREFELGGWLAREFFLLLFGIASFLHGFAEAARMFPVEGLGDRLGERASL